MLAVFSAVTFLTIVIVCANVTNLVIARRRAPAGHGGAGVSRRGRIVRSLAEGLVLSVVLAEEIPARERGGFARELK